MPKNSTHGLAMLNRGESQSKVYMAMQPIVDRQGGICAHTLRCQSGHFSYAARYDDTTIDSIVIPALLGKLGMRLEQSEAPVFVDAGPELLFANALEKMPPGMVVLRVLESVGQTTEFIERCRHLHGVGYTLSVDNFVFETSCEQLQDVVGIVRFDLSAQTLGDIEAACLNIKAQGRNVRCLAVNVESRAQYVRLTACGFDYFEGYFFARPHAGFLAVDRSSVRLMMHSLEILIEEDEHEIERFLLEHPSLFAELLAQANALSSCKGGGPIRTVDLAEAMHLALPVLSYTQLRHWLLVVLLARHLTKERWALIQLLVGRACFLADLAKDVDLDTDDAFLVGLLSLADALLDLPVADIVAQLNLHEAMAEALLFRGGRLGELLALCEFLEGYLRIDEAQDDPGLACTFAAFGQHRLMEAKSKAMFMASRLRFEQL